MTHERGSYGAFDSADQIRRIANSVRIAEQYAQDGKLLGRLHEMAMRKGDTCPHCGQFLANAANASPESGGGGDSHSEDQSLFDHECEKGG